MDDPPFRTRVYRPEWIPPSFSTFLICGCGIGMGIAATFSMGLMGLDTVDLKIYTPHSLGAAYHNYTESMLWGTVAGAAMGGILWIFITPIGWWRHRSEVQTP